MYLHAEGNDCTAQGGIYRQGSGIQAGGGNVEISVAGETGIASMEQSAVIRGKNDCYDIRVRAGEYMPIGAKEGTLSFEGGERPLKINED